MAGSVAMEGGDMEMVGEGGSSFLFLIVLSGPGQRPKMTPRAIFLTVYISYDFTVEPISHPHTNLVELALSFPQVWGLPLRSNSLVQSIHSPAPALMLLPAYFLRRNWFVSHILYSICMRPEKQVFY